MGPPTRVYTLADYHPVAPVRRETLLRGRREGVFDGHTVFVAPEIDDLYRDRTDAEFWLRFCRKVEVVRVPSLKQYLRGIRGDE